MASEGVSGMPAPYKNVTPCWWQLLGGGFQHHKFYLWISSIKILKVHLWQHPSTATHGMTQRDVLYVNLQIFCEEIDAQLEPRNDDLTDLLEKQGLFFGLRHKYPVKTTCAASKTWWYIYFSWKTSCWRLVFQAEMTPNLDGVILDPKPTNFGRQTANKNLPNWLWNKVSRYLHCTYISKTH